MAARRETPIEENIGEGSMTLDLATISCIRQNAQATKVKIYKLDYSKTKNFCASKNIKSENTTYGMRENI